MSNDLAVQIQRHEMLRDAHATLVQALKYPDTVHVQAVAKARSVIRAHAVLQHVLNAPAAEVAK